MNHGAPIEPHRPAALATDRSRSRSRRRTDPALPVIDIAPLFGRDGRAKRKVAEALGQAAEEAGFFYIEGHGVGQDAIDAVYRQAAQWFRRPVSEKLGYYIGRSRNHRGYVPRSEQGLYPDEGERHYEAFDLALDLPPDDPDVARGHCLLGPNVWPSQPGFRATIGGYYARLSRIGQVMCSALELYFRVPEGTLSKLMTKPTSQLRLLHYLDNDAANEAGDVNMGAHTDYEFFTILHQGAPGLQVLDGQGRWIDAPALEDTFAVNIGDLLETWSNGRFRATLHRVRNDGSERFSLPFFVAANYDAVIEPLNALLPGDQPPAYDAIVAGHHLLGQLLRDFPYLRDRHDRGEMKLPFPVPKHNPFEIGRLAPAPLAA